MNFEREDRKREMALAKEQERADRKARKRREMMNSSSYRAMVNTAKFMDKYFLDPILGFILPAGIGDALSSIFALPFVYFSLFKVKSIPLTLAVINNILTDILIGAIPFFIGDIFDIFKRSYIDNLKLITGYIEDDKEIISEVQRKAFWTALFIVLLCWLIYMVFSMAAAAFNWLFSL